MKITQWTIAYIFGAICMVIIGGSTFAALRDPESTGYISAACAIFTALLCVVALLIMKKQKAN